MQKLNSNNNNNNDIDNIYNNNNNFLVTEVLALPIKSIQKYLLLNFKKTND